ncbi:MAG: cell division protein ZapA [Bacteroidetes bacterium]|nr:cell division protein ZapA [Bacteroidota bacterium]MCY4232174.1 cell division protein ZapA [Bacteroidota bacterium]
MNQESITVRIFERDYRLLVSPDDVEMVSNLAENLNHRMDSFKQHYGDQPDLIAAVFIALELAQELYEEKESSNELLAAIDRETDYLNRVIELTAQQTSTISQ